MRVIFLGTAGSAPTKFRGLPSIAIDYNSEIFMFDCGEGTQRQMMQYSVNISKLKAIFLTHMHGDHTLGIAGLIRTLALNKRTDPLYIFMPKGGEKMIRDMIGFDKAVINYRIIIKAINPGEIYKGRGFTISAFKLLHTTSVYGFVFKENDKIKFIKQKIKNLGIKGKMFSSLLKNKSLKVGNRTIKLKDITFNKTGLKVVYATDTRPTGSTLKAAANANILIHESTYSDSERLLAKERFHSTALEAATLARKAKASRLILTHTSARYRDTNVLVNEARKVFKNTEIAKDGMIIIL